MTSVESLYQNLKRRALDNYSSTEVSQLIAEITLGAAEYLLNECFNIELKSLVKDKKYLCFSDKRGKLSRPINQELFSLNSLEIKDICKDFISENLEEISIYSLSKLLYTIGFCFPLYIDIIKNNDKKTPGTFFEILIGHIFAKRFGTNPRKKLEIPVVSSEVPKYLPTDLIFDLPVESYGLHVPIKSTTRERVIQVWAHQRILDSVYGSGRFRGILVVASETKLDSRRKEVIEICLPSQWRIYQLHIAEMKRIYYLDPPQVYLNLNELFPFLKVKSFAEFFKEPIKSF